MQIYLKNEKDLESFFNLVFSPLDERALEKALKAGNLISSIRSPDRPRLENLEVAINSIDDKDHRDIFRRKAALVFASMELWDAAVSIANHCELMIEKIDTLLLLANQLLESNKQQEAVLILDQVEKMAYEEDGESFWQWQKIKVLDEVGRILLQLKHRQKAVDTWKKALVIAQAGPLAHDEKIALRNMLVNLETLGLADLVKEVKELTDYDEIVKRLKK